MPLKALPKLASLHFKSLLSCYLSFVHDKTQPAIILNDVANRAILLGKLADDLAIESIVASSFSDLVSHLQTIAFIHLNWLLPKIIRTGAININRHENGERKHYRPENPIAKRNVRAHRPAFQERLPRANN